ncbi:MAG: hypothetical protein BWY79_01987 [Actinobacteria bacterium ADurb.Bin444]|nr:MAG: hypothetical protein BWY79_01987 [Actinobacteria bacterium ADurb.Bin444]
MWTRSRATPLRASTEWPSRSLSDGQGRRQTRRATSSPPRHLPCAASCAGAAPPVCPACAGCNSDSPTWTSCSRNRAAVAPPVAPVHTTCGTSWPDYGTVTSIPEISTSSARWQKTLRSRLGVVSPIPYATPCWAYSNWEQRTSPGTPAARPVPPSPPQPGWPHPAVPPARPGSTAPRTSFRPVNTCPTSPPPPSDGTIRSRGSSAAHALIPARPTAPSSKQMCPSPSMPSSVGQPTTPRASAGTWRLPAAGN